MSVILLAVGAVLLTSCHEKKQSADIITTKYVPKRPQAPIAMGAYSEQWEVKWLGGSYVASVERVAVDSLPMVADETGQKYVDNSISLDIRRMDGSVVFGRRFTKGSFASYLGADYQRSGLLTDIRFDDVVANEMRFSVTVSKPGDADDEYVLLTLAVNGNGGLGIKVEDDMGLR